MNFRTKEQWYLIKVLADRFFNTNIKVQKGYLYVLTDSITHKKLGFLNILSNNSFSIYNCKDHKTYKYELLHPQYLIFRSVESHDILVKGTLQEVEGFNKLLQYEIKQGSRKSFS